MGYENVQAHLGLQSVQECCARMQIVVNSVNAQVGMNLSYIHLCKHANSSELHMVSTGNKSIK